MTKQPKITLVKSPIGAIPEQRATVAALGLKKMYKITVMLNNAAVHSMVWRVRYLVRVKGVEK